ncbi:MAG: hypothetical protein J6Y82_05265 [Bacteroidales bacterium]|nr:hypothetical protein [Bacteroidales bacterium]
MKRYEIEKSELEHLMKYYRICGPFRLPVEYYYNYPRGTKRVYNGVDLSANGMATADIRKRIVQLLNDEFYPGEVDSMVNYLMNNELKNGDWYYYIKNDREEITRELNKKYSFDLRKLIIFCGALQDEEIKEILINAYKTDKYPENNVYYTTVKTLIQRTLARMGVEPYLSMYVEEYKYNSEDTPEVMSDKIEELRYIPRKETFLELSKYLLTDKYYISISESDISNENQKTIESDSYAEMEDDTTEIIITPYQIEIPEETYSESNEYIDYEALYAIYKSISNKELHDIFDDIIQRINSVYYYTSEDIHLMLTEKKRKRIYKWMKKNYNKYDFSNRW